MDYRVEELASSAALSVDTIRYYQKLGLLDPPDRQGRVAVYGDAHRDRLAEIAALSAKGFTLSQISRLSNHPDDRLLDALRADSDPELIDRSELAARSGLDSALVELAIDAGLVRHDSSSPDKFGNEAVDMLEAASTILDSGLPIDELIAVAVEHAAHVEGVIDSAIELFRRHLPPDADPAETVAELVPAVSELVAQHFRHTLLDRAGRRLMASDLSEATS